MRRKRIYVAGPLSLGDRALNVRKAGYIGGVLLRWGYAPLVPHLNNEIDPTDAFGYENWLASDLAWLEVADAVLRIPGESAGADREVARAQELGIPVFYQIIDLYEFLPPGEEHAQAAAEIAKALARP